MLAIPFRLNNEDEFSLFIALEQTSLDRMKDYDPVEVQMSAFTEPFRGLKLKDFYIGYISAEEMADVKEQLQKGEPFDVRPLLKQLSRGYRYRPDLGDQEEARYESLFSRYGDVFKDKVFGGNESEPEPEEGVPQHE